MAPITPYINRELNRLVPVPDCNGHRFALLEGTKSSFLVSDHVYELLQKQTSNGGQNTDTIAREIKRLKDLGFWYDNPKSFEISKDYISLSLHLVHGCNLACTYCNVKQGTYGEPFSLMDESTADAAIDFFVSIRNGRFPRLVFYGGEPLLNWDVLTHATKKIASIFAEREIQIVTNGTLIDKERAQFLADNEIFVIISIDGPKDIHDRNRPMKTGGSSYEKAVKGLEHLKTAGVRFHIRATWSPEYAPYDDVYMHLVEIAGNSRQVTVALEFSEANGSAIERYNELLFDKYRLAEEKGCELPNSTYQYLDQALRADWAPVPRCEAGHAGFSITPNGDIYPCQVSVSRKKFKLGTIYTGIDEKGRENLQEFLESSSPVCEKCWANNYCGGPCRYAVPIPDNWDYCKTVRLQIIEAFNFIARAHTGDLLPIYQAPEVFDEEIRAIKRGAALREILWKHNRHILPISICPQNGNNI